MKHGDYLATFLALSISVSHARAQSVGDSLQIFSSIHAQVRNHFNQERHLVNRDVYKHRRSAALAEWRTLAA